MRNLAVAVGTALALAACGGASSSASGDGGACESGSASCHGDSGRDAKGDSKGDSGGMMNLDAPAEAATVPCGSTTCGGNEYCINPSCGGPDTGKPCMAPAPFCTTLPAACNDSSATCTCLGSQQASICDGDSGYGGSCGIIDHKHRAVDCVSA